MVAFSSCKTESLDGGAAGNDYIEVALHYATGFRLFRKGDASSDEFKVMICDANDSTSAMATYYFGGGYKGVDSIAIPIRNAALNSTTFIAYFDQLAEIGKVDGVTFTELIMNAAMRAEIDAGAAVELTAGGELDFEKVLALNPSVFMAYAYGDSDFGRLEEQGIPIVLNMEYLEATPLGRVEWIKLVGILTGKYAEADSIYRGIEKRYQAIKMKAAVYSQLPMVFTGSRYKDLWYAPGSDSYIAKYIRDAGALYVFDRFSIQGSLQIDYESALKAVSDADYWGLVVSQESTYSKADLLDGNPAYTNFKAVQKSHVFICNAAQVDYFGDAIMEPDHILADLLETFHPGAIPDHEFSYFFPLGE